MDRGATLPSQPTPAREIDRMSYWPVFKASRPAFVLIIALLLGGAVLPANRIIAVGDVHGDLDNLTAMLQRTGIVDGSGAWTGGAGILVQTGDLLDRGPEDKAVLELLMRLQQEAPTAGGRVVTLLGNHEVMNLIGDLRYVNPEVYADFADNRSERRRRRAWKQYQRFVKRQANRYKAPPETVAVSQSEWFQQHPPGYLEHREAFSPKGRYGRWLRRQPVMERIGRVLFVHGGVTEALPDTMEAVNDRVANEIRQLDALRDYLVQKKIVLDFFDWGEMFDWVGRELEYQRAHPPSLLEPDQGYQQHLSLLEGFLASNNWLMNHPLGPLWNRSLAQDPDTPENRERVRTLLGRYEADRVVIGHTPQLDGIRSRFEGQVLIIDTGMLTEYYAGGTPSALELEGDRTRAVYPDREAPLP